MFLVTCKCLEQTDPKHSYKFFPSHDAWTWEQEPNYEDSSPTNRQGPQPAPQQRKHMGQRVLTPMLHRRMMTQRQWLPSPNHVVRPTEQGCELGQEET